MPLRTANKLGSFSFYPTEEVVLSATQISTDEVVCKKYILKGERRNWQIIIIVASKEIAMIFPFPEENGTCVCKCSRYDAKVL